MNSTKIKCTMTLAAATTVYSTDFEGGTFDFTNQNELGVSAMVTGTTLSGSLKLQQSNDGTNYIDCPNIASQSLGVSGGLLMYEGVLRHMRYRFALTSANTNAISVDIQGVAKGW